MSLQDTVASSRLTVRASARVCPYLAAVVLPEPLLQRLSQLAQQEAVV